MIAAAKQARPGAWQGPRETPIALSEVSMKSDRNTSERNEMDLPDFPRRRSGKWHIPVVRRRGL